MIDAFFSQEDNADSIYQNFYNLFSNMCRCLNHNRHAIISFLAYLCLERTIIPQWFKISQN